MNVSDLKRTNQISPSSRRDRIEKNREAVAKFFSAFSAAFLCELNGNAFFPTAA
jgi:hypothetical protein